MGQKVHPYGFRVVHTKNWKSKWFAKREYAALLHEDLKLRKELKAKLHGLNAMVSKIDIERAADDSWIGAKALMRGFIGNVNVSGNFRESDVVAGFLRGMLEGWDLERTARFVDQYFPRPPHTPATSGWWGQCR